jgi:hypothetical protein
MKIKLGVAKISKAHLNRLSEEEQVLFVHLGSLHNELNMILKFMLAADFAAQRSKGVENTGHVSQSWLCATMLILKLCEGKLTLLEGFYKKKEPLSIEYQNILSNVEGAQELLDKIDECFKPPWLIYKIRNKIAAHYDHKAVKAALNKMVPEDVSDWVVGKERCNCLFALSRDIEMRRALDLASPLDPEELRGKLCVLFDLIHKTTGHFLDFLHACLEYMFEKMGLDEVEEVEWVGIREPPRIKCTKLSYFWSSKDKA